MKASRLMTIINQWSEHAEKNKQQFKDDPLAKDKYAYYQGAKDYLVELKKDLVREMKI
jgi:hypothetical protein